VSIPKYSKSKSLFSLDSFEGPPISSEKLLASGALDPTEDTCDPEATEEERGTDPEREPTEVER
jgi:hypothetical protein